MIFTINNYTFVFSYSNIVQSYNNFIYFKQNDTTQKIDIKGFKDFIRYSLFLSKINFENDNIDDNINDNVIFEYFKGATYLENNYFFGSLLNTLIYYYYFNYASYLKLVNLCKIYLKEIKYKKYNYYYFYFFIYYFRYYIIKGDYITTSEYLTIDDIIFDYNLS